MKLSPDPGKQFLQIVIPMTIAIYVFGILGALAWNYWIAK